MNNIPSFFGYIDKHGEVILERYSTVDRFESCKMRYKDRFISNISEYYKKEVNQLIEIKAS